MNYKQAAKDIRDAMRPIRKDAGKWLIADMKKAWDRGDMKYVIHPGTYAISEPIPAPFGSTVDGDGKATLQCSALYIAEWHPDANGGWISGPMPPFDDDYSGLAVWGEDEAFQQV